MKPVLTLFLCAGVCFASEPVVPLWSGAAPGSEGWTQKEIEYKDQREEAMVRNIVVPSLTVFLPEKSNATGTGIIVAPGGGFRFLSWDSEGTKVAKWLNERGVAAFVLKYRVAETPADPKEFQDQMNAMFGRSRSTVGRGAAAQPNSQPNSGRGANQSTIPLAIADGKQALRIVRQHAAEWGVATDKVGLIGFSAGAILTTGRAHQLRCRDAPEFRGIHLRNDGG